MHEPGDLTRDSEELSSGTLRTYVIELKGKSRSTLRIVQENEDKCSP
jgi:hypothetical protein